MATDKTVYGLCPGAPSSHTTRQRDLGLADAIIGGNNDAFTFIGADVFSAAGQVRQFHQGNVTVIEGDVTGDGNADFQIALLTRGLVLTADDFVL